MTTATLTRSTDATTTDPKPMSVHEIYTAAEAARLTLDSLNLRPERRATIETLLSSRNTRQMQTGLKMVAADEVRREERRVNHQIVTEAGRARYDIRTDGLEWIEPGLGANILRLLSSENLDDKLGGVALFNDRRAEATSRAQRSNFDAVARRGDNLSRTIGLSEVAPMASNRSKGKGRRSGHSNGARRRTAA